MKLRKVSGFTMIELLMIMAIIGVMGGFILVQYPSVTERARDTQRKSDLSQYKIALEKFANANNGLYPSYTNTTTGDLASTTLCAALNMNNCPEDPQGTIQYRYQSNGSGSGSVSGTTYLLWSTLERPETAGSSWVACSTGESGEITASSTGYECQYETPPLCGSILSGGVFATLSECQTACAALVGPCSYTCVSGATSLPPQSGNEGSCPI